MIYKNIWKISGKYLNSEKISEKISEKEQNDEPTAVRVKYQILVRGCL